MYPIPLVLIAILAVAQVAQVAPPVRSINLTRLLALMSPGDREAGLARQFTPQYAPPGAFDVFVSDDPIALVSQRFARLAGSAGVEGAWVVGPADIWEAFGTVGRYDRSRLARLYGARRPDIARGPIIRAGATVASVTLISPHPDAALTTLVAGTMTVAMDFRSLP